MDKLIEHNENLGTPVYLPSHLETLKETHEYFEVPDLETKISRHNNPHYWLQHDILQIKQFQYRFFQNIILNEDTVPQIKVFSHFLLKFFRFSYQIIWEQQDQNAYINFPQVLTETELLPFKISDRNKHVHYRNLTSFNINNFELINFDHNFLLERSETSVSRPYTTSNIIYEPSLNEHNPNILQHDTGQNILHFDQDNTTKLLQNQEPQHFIIIQDPQQITTTLQDVPDPPETATIQNVSELSDETVINTQSLTMTNDSNTLQIPVHDVTQNPNNTQDQNNTTRNTNPDKTSTLSTSNTHVTQEFQTQQISPRNYDSPSIPPQYSLQTSAQNSPQQGSSNTQTTNTVQLQQHNLLNKL